MVNTSHVIVSFRSGNDDRGNSTHWDFDGDSSETMVRVSKFKETDGRVNATPNSNHHGDTKDMHLTSNHLDDKSTISPEFTNHQDGGEGVDSELPLGIDDTVFVSEDFRLKQRSSVVSLGEGDESRSKRGSTISVEGSSGLVAVR